MKNRSFAELFIGVLLISCLFTACSDVLLDEMNSRTASNYMPVPSLAEGSLISGHETLGFVFAESMNIDPPRKQGHVDSSYLGSWLFWTFLSIPVRVLNFCISQLSTHSEIWQE